MYIRAPYVNSVSGRPKESNGSPGTGIRDNSKLGIQHSPFQEWPVFLILSHLCIST